MAITYRGERFAGYNKPKKTPKHKTKSHVVLAKEGDKIKLIRLVNKEKRLVRWLARQVLHERESLRE